jgi:hypothetical protein
MSIELVTRKDLDNVKKEIVKALMADLKEFKQEIIKTLKESKIKGNKNT